MELTSSYQPAGSPPPAPNFWSFLSHEGARQLQLQSPLQGKKGAPPQKKKSGSDLGSLGQQGQEKSLLSEPLLLGLDGKFGRSPAASREPDQASCLWLSQKRM